MASERNQLLQSLTGSAITNSYPASGIALHKSDGDPKYGSPRISGQASGLFVFVSAVSGSSSLSCVLTEDQAGDRPLMPETTAAIQAGMTTATKGGIVIRIDLRIYDSEEPIYLWCKSDAGSCTIDDVLLTYRG
tara:strand:- start:181 stop:582 length:402 start_codon:yes stop_codon:yes gene_type:complete